MRKEQSERERAAAHGVAGSGLLERVLCTQRGDF